MKTVTRIIHQHHRGDREAAKAVERNKTAGGSGNVVSFYSLALTVAPAQAGAQFLRVAHFFPNSGSILTSAAIANAGMVARHVQTKKCW